MRTKTIAILLLILGCSIGLFLLGRVSTQAPIEEQGELVTVTSEPSMIFQPESPAKNLDEPPQPAQHQSQSVGMVQDDGKISYIIAKNLNLTDTEILALQSIVDTHLARISLIFAEHALPDPVRTDPAKGIEAFRVPAFPKGQAERQRLREALKLGFGEKAEAIFDSLGTTGQFGDFGSNDVLIQFNRMNDDNEVRIFFTAQEYSPQTGNKIRGVMGRMGHFKRFYGSDFKINGCPSTFPQW